MSMLLAVAGVVLAGVGVGDDAVRLAALPSGAMKKIGYYAPQRLELSADKPAALKKAPDGLEAPLYGVLPIAGADGAVFCVILDEPDGKPGRLFVDSNGNGDLTDDAATEWKSETRGQMMMYRGSATVDIGDLGSSFPAALGMYRFDKNDPARAELKNTILYYRDYGREGEATIGGKSYHVMLADEGAAGDFSKPVQRTAKAGAEVSEGIPPQILIDVNGNGKFDNRGERFKTGEPFNIGGTTYEVAGMTRTGDQFTIVKSDKTVAEIATPPDHSAGKKITAFDAKTMDGKALKFPSDYKGKIVMLDFWATWCGPCMMEVPGLVETYKKYHDQGFEVLGVTLDRENMTDKVKTVTAEKGMSWPQIYDGKFWQAEIAQLFAIDSIPATFLVDGDTGEIIARDGDLRGEALAGTIEKALAKKAGK